MRPILFQFRDIRLFSYTVFLDLALIAGLLVAYLMARRYRVAREHVLDAALWSAIGGLVGARAQFVLANWEYYASRPGEIWQFWQGGMAFGGGFLVGAGVCYAYSRLSRTSIWDLLDVLAPGLAVASAFAWIGNLLAGSAYGKPGRGLGYLFLPDIYGSAEYRFATQIVSAASCVVILVIVWLVLRRRPWPGAPFAAYLVLVGTTQFALEFTRGDDTLLLAGLRLAQWLDLGAALAGVALFILLWRSRTSPQEKVEVFVE